MSQLPANVTLGVNHGVNAEATPDTDITSDVLPSADHSSGLTPAVRHHLIQQFQSSGSADSMVSELRARIAEIDQRGTADDDPDHARLQAERALLVAQISYVEDDLAVHGIPADMPSLPTDTTWQDTGTERAVGESTSASIHTGRRVRVYDSTKH